MFELSIALKYLIPKKRALSTSLISLLSIFVISLVVWLCLVFLSVTTGIEKNWLTKLTSINAPLRISPTDEYYRSYYYQIDAISRESHYQNKAIGEKALAIISDPYSPLEDIEIPPYWPQPDRLEDGTLKDPVKGALSVLDTLKGKYPDLSYQDYEMSGALLRLSLRRNNFFEEKMSYLSQMSYLLSLTDHNPKLSDLILPPRVADLNHLLYQLDKSLDEIQKDSPEWVWLASSETKKKRLQSFFKYAHIQRAKVRDHYRLLGFLPKQATFTAFLSQNENRIVIPLSADSKIPGFKPGKISYESGSWTFETEEGSKRKLSSTFPTGFDQHVSFSAHLIDQSLEKAHDIKDVLFHVTGSLQGVPIEENVSFYGFEIEKADPVLSLDHVTSNEPLWGYFLNEQGTSHFVLPEDEEATGVLLPKAYQDTGVLLYDYGFLSYLNRSAASTQEQRITIRVMGFYDPGIMPVGNRCLFVPHHITRTIHSSSPTTSSEATPHNGILVWFNDIKQAQKLQEELNNQFKNQDIANYWQITPFHEYEFSKDLMQQFQSDRTLFTLIAAIILIVACSNIISLLVLLVNDKKREIAVLQAMGTSKKSIALLFGFCGIITGVISSMIGTLAAIWTLNHLDHLVTFLSAIQGHAAFNAAFFGNNLPNALSIEALVFVLIVTPVISLAAGLIPALKASRIHPSQILRSE